MIFFYSVCLEIQVDFIILKLEQICIFRCDKDYGELTETLKRLSSEHKLDIMVPLTKKAFMPGQVKL